MKRIRFGVLFILMLLAGDSWAQEYYVNVYDTTRGSSGFYEIKTKFVNLETKAITDEFILVDEGEIINTIPIDFAIYGDTVLITAIVSKCICKNTSAGDYNTNLSIINLRTRQLSHQYDLPGQLIIDFRKNAKTELFVERIYQIGDSSSSLDGIYNLNSDFNLNKIRQVVPGYFPGSYKGLTPNSFSILIGNELYYDIVDNDFIIVKLDGFRDMYVDSLIFHNYDSANQVFAVKDSLLYVFALNYETHLDWPFNKGYGDEWIDNHVNIYNITDFTLRDSLSVPDYPRGDFINGKTGVADVMGPFIVYFFGDSNDISQLYPAMLFIFDTRTNEATWLRVGWSKDE